MLMMSWGMTTYKFYPTYFIVSQEDGKISFQVNDNFLKKKNVRLKKCIWIPSIIAIHREPFSKEEVNGYGIYIFLDCYISIALYFKTMSMGCDAPN